MLKLALQRGARNNIYRITSNRLFLSNISNEEENVKVNWSKTLNLPKTKFALRANASVKEPLLLNELNVDLYEYSKNRNTETFLLHDGPPYANGNLHTGHFLNKSLKDFINRYSLMKGNRIEYIPGWDCHGLPIELKAIETIRKKAKKNKTAPVIDSKTPEGVIALRNVCRDVANDSIEKQKKSFMRWGIMGDWENPYLTMNPEYEAEQLSVFQKMVEKGLIFRGYKPVYWSPSSKSALAEAELEYNPNHVSTSVYVKYPVKKVNGDLRNVLNKDSSLLIWTTTPWTLPSNMAICVNENIEYSIIEKDSIDETKKEILVVASDLLPSISSTIGFSYKVLSILMGSELIGNVEYESNIGLHKGKYSVIGGNHVTTQTGTGLVHTAPGHGHDDFVVGSKNNIGEPISPVDDFGKYKEIAGDRLAGKNVLKEGNEEVLKILAEEDMLFHKEDYTHKYPYDWRTKKPVIMRSTEQWFADVSNLTDSALESLKNVKLLPETSRNRLEGMLTSRSDWCISRQRVWGVPIPSFFYKDTGKYLMNSDIISHIKEVFREHGSDSWWTLELEDLLPYEYHKDIPNLERGQDTMDVWFDSGSSWKGVVNPKIEDRVADIYLEGSDQHRGWFQSSLLTSVAARGIAPYKKILTHGFVLDEKGQKMSKSLGNIVDPNDYIDKREKLGADTLRLWASSVDYTSDVSFGPTILKGVSEKLRKLRNTSRFLLGNLYDFQLEDSIPVSKMDKLVDKYVLHSLFKLRNEVYTNMESQNFPAAVKKLSQFATSDLSSGYLDIVKDRLYLETPNSFERRSAQTVLYSSLAFLTKGLSPFIPFTTTDIFNNSNQSYWSTLENPNPKNIFENGWIPEFPVEYYNENIEESWKKILDLRSYVNKALETGRSLSKVGSSTEAEIHLYISDELKNILPSEHELEEIFIVSNVEFHSKDENIKKDEFFSVLNNENEDTSDKFSICLKHASGEKCPRCWKWSVLENNGICSRCTKIIQLN